jgi:glutamyl-tRNA synthetase
MYKTRIAPSPTGDMHLGTARTAYMNYLAAKATGGEFILRIDDTDSERNTESALFDILQTIEWLGLDYDSIHYQSKRHNIYKYFAHKLLENGLASRLDNGAVALNAAETPVSWFDEVSGEIKVTEHDKKMIDGLILLKGDDKNNTPTYNFASISDDYDLEINFIIRGNDHISNTVKQIAIWNALNKSIGLDRPVPKFAHVGLIHYNKKKLSKRDGAASMLTYKEQGYLPEAMLNFMLRLGWAPAKDDSKEAWFIDKERAKTMFLTEGKMRSASSNMDIGKLDWLNRTYKAKQR